MTAAQFQSAGRVIQNGYNFTYYNLDMSGVQAMHNTIFHDRGDGVLVDPAGLIVLAYGMTDYGQIIETPLGTGKVYDHCPGGAVDIAVNF